MAEGENSSESGLLASFWVGVFNAPKKMVESWAGEIAKSAYKNITSLLSGSSSSELAPKKDKTIADLEQRLVLKDYEVGQLTEELSSMKSQLNDFVIQFNTLRNAGGLNPQQLTDNAKVLGNVKPV